MKTAFDEVATGVGVAIKSTPPRAYRKRGNHGPHVPRSDFSDERIGVVARVAEERCALSIVEQLHGCGHFVALAGRERDVERPALAVGDRVDLGGEAASTTTQTVEFGPPFPPAASW